MFAHFIVPALVVFLFVATILELEEALLARVLVCREGLDLMGLLVKARWCLVKVLQVLLKDGVAMDQL